jgi:ABC-2 type transport system ATP-binding protein
VGAGTIIQVRLERPEAGLATRLRELAGVHEVDPMPGGLVVMAQGREGLVSSLVEAAIPYGLKDLAIAEPTLETVFIKLTGRDLRD